MTSNSTNGGITDQMRHDKILMDCFDRAFHCYGYSYIFEKRALFFNRCVTFIKAFGIIVPAMVGITAMGYKYDNAFLRYLIFFAVPLAIIQFILSLVAIIYKWDDELSYAYDANNSYSSLYSKFKKLASVPPKTLIELSDKFDVIDIEKTIRGNQDSQHGIKEWEYRKGMRYSLREHEKTCKGCGIIPLSMDSTECPVCGKYTFKYRTFIHKLTKP